MTARTITAEGPAAWAGALISNDWSGLQDDEERARCRAWLDQHEGFEPVDVLDQEPRFTWHFALYAGPLEDPAIRGGDVVRYLLLRRP